MRYLLIFLRACAPGEGHQPYGYFCHGSRVSGKLYSLSSFLLLQTGAPIGAQVKKGAPGAPLLGTSSHTLVVFLPFFDTYF